MVDRVMRKRMAHGGEVTADEQPNEFDVLELEPAPEADYPGSNEHGDAELEDEDRDMVSRIMRSRKKTA